jgi:hypothetical protein
MSINEIETEWAKDSRLGNDMQEEITRTASLHSKWYEKLNAARRALLTVDVEIQKFTNVLESFYSRTMTLQEMKQFGFEELPSVRLVKGDLDKAVSNHQKMIELKVRRGLAIDKIKFLEDIIKSVHARGFLIRDMIEWKKFQAGV